VSGPAQPRRTPETAAQRKARLDAIFGDSLPDTTSDERDPGSGRDEQERGDDWLRAQVPPHHGD
jgi:hypothetical protein